MEREISVSGGVFLLLSLENVGGFLKWWIPKSPWVVKMFQYKNGRNWMSWYPPPSSPGPITWLSDSPEATINLRGIYLNAPLQRVSWIFMEILRLKCFKYGSNMVC
jgi:hypothetical protein